MVAWEGLTHAEAAEALGISPGAARTRLHRARRRALKTLKELGVSGRGGSELVTTLYARKEAS